MRDGGRSPAIGLQEQVANHRKRLWSKAGVVSVTEKALQRRQVGDRKANTREPPFKCRKCSDDVEMNRPWFAGGSDAIRALKRYLAREVFTQKTQRRRQINATRIAA